MLSNYLAAALRNLLRNRTHAAISLFGLSLGFAAALLIALYVRDEVSYDSFIPGYDRTYQLEQIFAAPGQPLIVTPTIGFEYAALLKLDFPSIEAIARLLPNRRTLRHGQIEADENLYWADPDLFEVLPLRPIAGNLSTALRSPDGIVLTRSMARKYFGRDDPIGEEIQIDNRIPMRVTAVLEDLPSNTHLNLQIIASGIGANSELSLLDKDEQTGGHTAHVYSIAYTYLRLRPGASADALRRALPAFLARRDANFVRLYRHAALALTRLDQVHLTPVTEQSMKPRGDWPTLYATSLGGALILLVAAINFINLTTARATQRAVEVGVRKTSGATRRQVMAQFLGETTLYAVLSMIIAVVIVALLLPRLNAFLDRAIVFAWSDLSLVGTLIGVALLIGVLAGIYPAMVLSSFSPASVLKFSVHGFAGSKRLRETLVTLQFAVLIAFTIASTVIYQQMHYALNEGLRVDKDQVLLISTPCTGAFPGEVRTLPGVRLAACANSPALNLMEEAHWGLRLPDGTLVQIDGDSVDYGFLELYGLRPIAGRFFSHDHPGDSAALELGDALDGALGKGAPPDRSATPLGPVVLNGAAVRLAGFKSPEDAIGKRLYAGGRPLDVIGVVRDFSLDTVRKKVPATFYVIFPPSFDVLSVKLSGREIPRTLTAIDHLWKSTGNIKPITRFFLDQHMQELYLDITRRAQAFGAFSAIAVSIAAFGLLGLAIFTAAQRTKEIGLRKVMGASRADILRFLGWQFARPVLWANLVAWPCAYVVMQRWLEGFVYHVRLDPLIFVGASAVALVIALATVAGHALLVARAKPVAALRYE